MGDVIQFPPRPDREARLAAEARAIYESIFPTEMASNLLLIEGTCGFLNEEPDTSPSEMNPDVPA